MGNMDNKLETLDDKNKAIEKTMTDLESKKPVEPTVKKEDKQKSQRVLLTSLNSQSNIELDENLQNQLKQMSEEIKEHQSVSIENEEQIQQINKRLSTLEGGSAGVLGFLERVDEVSYTLSLWHPPHRKLSIDFQYQVEKNIRKELKDRIGAIEKITDKMAKEHRKMDKSSDELRSKIKNIKLELERKLSDTEDEILNELEKVKLLAEAANTQTEMQGSIDMPKLNPEAHQQQFSTNPQDAFKIRNQIQDMWKTLRLDIAHRLVLTSFRLNVSCKVIKSSQTSYSISTVSLSTCVPYRCK